jgi:threonine/homoserine/homoserine lactone efflux protein
VGGVPPTTHLLEFAITAFVLIVVPGPSVLFVVSRGVALGRRAALATVAGNTAGVFVQVVLVALGMGTLVERSETVFTGLKLVGAVYLALLGVRMIRHRRPLAAAADPSRAPKATRAIVREGFVVGLTNPKAAVVFTVVLPQFTDPSRGHVPLQLLLLGAMFLSIGVVSDSAWAIAAGTARVWLARSRRRLEMVAGAGGVVLIGLGLRLAVTGRND